MVRMILVVLILGFGVVTFMPDLLRDSTSGTGVAPTLRQLSEGVPQFDSRLDAGAGCAELISVRDTFEPSRPEVARMNEKLGAIGCDSPASERFR
jgi:hypothetical protein